MKDKIAIIVAALLVIFFTAVMTLPVQAQTEVACSHWRTGVIQMFPCCACPIGWYPA